VHAGLRGIHRMGVLQLIRFLLPLLLVLAGPATALADADTGRNLFEERGCRNCHTLHGKGGKVGPDLSAAGAVAGHDRSWHVRHLLAPSEVSPGSFMPPIKDVDDVEHLADFLITLKGTAGAAPEPPPLGTSVQPNLHPGDVVITDALPAAGPPAPESAKPKPVAATPVSRGDAARGQELFEGSGCRSCHQLNGDGGQVGPDLTDAGLVSGHDEAWHVRHLRAPAEVSPGSFMPPVADEQDAMDLAAFLITLKGTGATGTPRLKPKPVSMQPDPASKAVFNAPRPPSPQDAQAVVRGQSVYAAKGCSGCHTVRGIGGSLGPDLTFEGEVAEHTGDWHRDHLRRPSSVTPGSTMPPFQMEDGEMSDLVAYLLSLRHLAADRTLTAEMSGRFIALGTRLAVLQERVEHARHGGRNVDDLSVRLSEAWTEIGAVEEMMRRQEVTGADQKIVAAEESATGLELVLTEFEQQLRDRTRFVMGSLGALLVVCVLLLGKIRLLNREWWMEQEAEGGYAWRRPALEAAEAEKDS